MCFADVAASIELTIGKAFIIRKIQDGGGMFEPWITFRVDVCFSSYR